jgi:pentose-5-phosphate-3-epimerase
MRTSLALLTALMLSMGVNRIKAGQFFEETRITKILRCSAIFGKRRASQSFLDGGSHQPSAMILHGHTIQTLKDPMASCCL